MNKVILLVAGVSKHEPVTSRSLLLDLNCTNSSAILCNIFITSSFIFALETLLNVCVLLLHLKRMAGFTLLLVQELCVSYLTNTHLLLDETGTFMVC